MSLSCKSLSFDRTSVLTKRFSQLSCRFAHIIAVTSWTCTPPPTTSITSCRLPCCHCCWQAGCVVSAGGLGFADVAVTCLTRAAPLRQQTEEARAPPLSPNLTWQELQGQAPPAGPSPGKTRAGLLGSAFGAAANALKAIGNPARNATSRF